jgi:hypothetical protein
MGPVKQRFLRITMRPLLLALAFPALLAAAPVQALEPYKIYDRFTDKTIDPVRWSDTEKIREIKGGAMRLMQRTYGLGGSDVGFTPTNWQTNLSNPQNITELKATITVTALEAIACPSNASVGDARARIIGGFFNTGTPTPGSQLNDAIAQVRIVRFSNSTDPAGLLHVSGVLSVCTSADCNNAVTVGNVVDLGTVTVGTPITVSLQWDKPGKTFYFSREGGTTGTVAYAESDASPPGFPFKQVSTRVNVPSCQSAPRVSSLVDAVFDNVFVNRSAAP